MKQNVLKAFGMYVVFALIPVIVLLLAWIGSLCSFDVIQSASNEAYFGFNMFWNIISAIACIIHYFNLAEALDKKIKSEEEKKAEMAYQLQELEFDRILTEAVRRNVEDNLTCDPEKLEKIVSKKGVVYQNIPNSKL